MDHVGNIASVHDKGLPSQATSQPALGTLSRWTQDSSVVTGSKKSKEGCHHLNVWESGQSDLRRWQCR